MVPKNVLLHNATYTLKIRDDIVNNTTRQEVATLTFVFVTGDGDRVKATATVDDGSVVDTKVILKPTILIDFQKDILSSDLTKARGARMVY